MPFRWETELRYLRNIGLLGGTFDPVHAGHIALAREALTHGLDEVWFVPFALDHRSPAAEESQRINMLHLAVDGIPQMKVSKVEAKHSGSTAQVVSRLCQKNPDCRFTFIIGADQLISLPEWYCAGELFRQCELMCFSRPGTDMDQYLSATVRTGARICIPDNAFRMDVSGTGVREQVSHLQDPAEIDKKVLRYIALHGLYLPDIRPMLRKMITEKRYSHTLGVRNTAVELALHWDAPVIKAAVAGMLHDCAKSMPLREAIALAKARCLDIEEDEMTSNAMLHGPVGSVVAREKFGVTDPDVLSAIRFHTAGRPGMSLLEKIIFVSDVIEPGRENFDGLSEIRAAAYTDIDRACLMCLRATRNYVISQGKPFYPVSYLSMKYFESLLENKNLSSEITITE